MCDNRKFSPIGGKVPQPVPGGDCEAEGDIDHSINDPRGCASAAQRIMCDLDRITNDILKFVLYTQTPLSSSIRNREDLEIDLAALGWMMISLEDISATVSGIANSHCNGFSNRRTRNIS